MRAPLGARYSTNSCAHRSAARTWIASMTSGMTSLMKGRKLVPLTSASAPSVDRTVCSGARNRQCEVKQCPTGTVTEVQWVPVKRLLDNAADERTHNRRSLPATNRLSCAQGRRIQARNPTLMTFVSLTSSRCSAVLALPPGPPPPPGPPLGPLPSLPPCGPPSAMRPEVPPRIDEVTLGTLLMGAAVERKGRKSWGGAWEGREHGEGATTRFVIAVRHGRSQHATQAHCQPR